MKISILVPVFNEAETIQAVIKKLNDVNLGCEKEIIIIDDGSKDATPKILKKLIKNKPQNKIFTHSQNKGKGEALKTGIKNVTGDYILIQDADLEYNPFEIQRLVNKISANTAVYGSRFLNNSAQIPLFYYLGNRLLTYLTNALYGVRLTDMETGYKLIPSNAILNLKIQSSHFDFEPEITAKLIRQKIKIKEVSISYKGRTRIAGKKLTPIDALEAVWALVYYRFAPLEYK